MKPKLLKLLCVVLALLLISILLRSTIRPLDDSTSYGKDILGFIYVIPGCGWIGPCFTSYNFIWENAVNFRLVKDEDCIVAKGINLHVGDERLPFKSFQRIKDSDFFTTNNGIYYDCSFQETPLDTKSVKVVTRRCAIDNKISYCYGRRISELDPTSTTFVNNYFAVTASNQVWYLPQKLKVEGVDGNSFEYISTSETVVHMIKDKNGVYYYDWTRKPPLSEKPF